MLRSNVSLDVARFGWRRRVYAVGAAAALVASSLAAGSPTASASPEPAAQVDAEVLSELADRGSARFFVYLEERADLSPAATIRDKAAKGRFVYDRLTATAEASQADLVADLTAAGVPFTPFWISNTILVRGDRALLDELAARPDVSHIEPHRTWPVPAPRAGTDQARVNAVEWGIANINADDVWNEFGVRGEGVVVANIDTGVDFDHPALVSQYRGNTGSGFDHNHNWFDPANVCPSDAPCDNNNHGTHTMGTMVGDDGSGNQIGVAPRAQWIAAKGCESSSCSSSSLLASGEWVLAPTDLNGQNPDPSKAPDVVNNSWGGGRGDTWYQDTINAWIDAGIFPAFANGNSGPGCGTANSPGDNIPAYGVGAYDINNNIAGFSSRGPSGVDSSEIKPNIAAPGVNVRSSVNGGGYANFSGTSMATPHVAGTVALVWSAAPDVAGDIGSTRAVLDDTARDVNSTGCGGTVDDNNNFGEGRIDAHAAVAQVIGDGNLRPTAEFTFTCDDATLTCDFDGSASSDPDGQVVAWSWDFGDGSTGSGETVSHTYAEAGTFTVTLTVTDDADATGTTSRRVTVGPNQAPTADFTFDCNAVFFFHWCTFDGSPSSDPDGEVVAWDWNFGDGSTGSGESVFHFYSSAGTRAVTLTVTDDLGATGSTTKAVPVP